MKIIVKSERDWNEIGLRIGLKDRNVLNIEEKGRMIRKSDKLRDEKYRLSESIMRVVGRNSNEKF